MALTHLLFSTFILASGLRAFAGVEELCFKNAGLKDEQTVSLKIDESRVTGTYEVVRDYDSESAEKFEFTGTRSGKVLKVKFKGNKLPSPGMKSLNWTLLDDGEKQVLRIKFNSKNYETGKYEDTPVEFEACEPSYAELAKNATRVSLDGAGQARQTVKLDGSDERQAFVVNVPKGKALGVTAPMLRIAFYYPDKKKHGEPGMDSFTSDKVRQGGNCLVVVHRYSTPDGQSAEGAENTIEFSLNDGD